MSDNKNLKSACRAVWLWVPVAFPSRVQQSEKLFRLNLLSEISRHIFNPFFFLSSAEDVAFCACCCQDQRIPIRGVACYYRCDTTGLGKEISQRQRQEANNKQNKSLQEAALFPFFLLDCAVTVLKWTKLRRNRNNNYTVWLLIKLKGEGWCIQHFIICLSSVKG